MFTEAIKILVEFILLLHFSSATPSLWTIPDLFSANSLHFVIRYENNSIGTSDQELSYFHTLIKNNPYSAILFHHFLLTPSQLLILSRLEILPRSQKPLVTFFHLSGDILLETYRGAPAHLLLQNIVVTYFNPQFIFQHCEDPWNPINYGKYHIHSGTSKLILTNFYQPEIVLTPCVISAIVSPSVLMVTKDFSLSKLALTWNSLNNNLLKSDVEVDTRNRLDKFDCSVHFFNLKIGRTQSNNPMSIFYPTSIFDDYVYNVVLEHSDVFKFVYNRIRFSVVTHVRAEFQGIKDKTVTAAGVLDDLIIVISVLLGQTNGNSLKLFCGRNTIAAPILTVWLLAGYYIITNNLYRGEIYSYLTATKLPVVPTSLAQLVASNLPILTRSSITTKSSGNRQISTLKTSIIPLFMQKFENNSNFFAVCSKLNDKLQFMDIGTTFRDILRLLSYIITSKPAPYPDTTFPTERTFAVMDDTVNIKFLTELIKIYGGRLVIDGKDDNNPFNFITIDTGYSNFLSPVFQKTLSHLEAMGLAERWASLEDSKTIAMQLYHSKNPRYRWYFSSYDEHKIPIQEEIPIPFESMLSAASGAQISIFVSMEIDEQRHFPDPPPRTSLVVFEVVVLHIHRVPHMLIWAALANDNT
ncbi:hypothetical protein Fcan01_25340 [Folsomia candida]|uniref:Uncharacterized protein n=1 Tax=Folsomia candida TaxID=158441 RepID=A0A226D4Q8_FOLCA|nr:hypothetical protein Fcan01_25340 [Folsomia candida]